MKLKATRKTYELSDASGYGFSIVAEDSEIDGWSASVVMRTTGCVTAEDAVKHLRYAAEHFLRQLKAVAP